MVGAKERLDGLNNDFRNAAGGVMSNMDRVWEAYRATLPQDSFAFPMNYIEECIDSYKPLTAMTLDEAVTTTGDNMFTFTPPKSGVYNFLTAGPDWYNQRISIIDADYTIIVSGDYFGYGFTIPLLAGETYYVLVTSWSDRGHKFVVTDDLSQDSGPDDPDDPDPPKPGLAQRLVRWVVEQYRQFESTVFGRIVMLPLMGTLMIIALPFTLPIGALLWVIRGY